MGLAMEGGSRDDDGCRKRKAWVWVGIVMAMMVRAVFVVMGAPSLLGRRVEIATPLNSFIRLAEGYWLKQVGISPYAGSAYHGSPLFIAVLGPFMAIRKGGQFNMLLPSSLVCLPADLIAALLLREIGWRLQSAWLEQIHMLKLSTVLQGSTKLVSGDIAALFYLWNPLTIASCVGGCTSSVENLMVIISLFGAVSGCTPLAAFGWAMATHLSLYPAILFIPVALCLAFGVDHPPKKLLTISEKICTGCGTDALITSEAKEQVQLKDEALTCHYSYCFKWKKLRDLIIWSLVWWLYIFGLCAIAMRGYGGLHIMFLETYGFILTVRDLSPNLGMFWYFFTEVFDFFRPFFLLVFHANILFMILPLTIRLHHRPVFLAFVFSAISAMLKSYPSVGDAALYSGLMPLLMYELSGMRFTFFLLNGYVGIALLSPVMYNLWIWRGTGNANFYFATALAYACIQLILIVESVSTVLLFDRNLKKLKQTVVAEKA